MSVKFSKAIPISFWLNGQQVYNSQTNDFVDFKKFFQKVGCTAQVLIQFTDTEQHSYILRFLDEDDVEITTEPFVAATYPNLYRYTASFNFQAKGICDQKVKLQIFSSSNEITGSVNDLLETVSGTITVSQTITGQVDDLLETVKPAGAGGHIQVFNSDSFKVDTDISLCGETPITLYWGEGEPWGQGATMYTDQALTTLATGWDFIALDSDGEIFNIDDVTAVVGVTTSTFC